MKCPSCGNTTFERLDYSIVRCTKCFSVWNPSIFSDFPETKIEIGQTWDSDEDNDIEKWDDEDEDEDLDD